MLTAILVTVVAAYFLGSIPTGYLVGRVRGIDLRKSGSGNIGATNALRILGKGPGTFVLLADAFKGFAACTWLPSAVLATVPLTTPDARNSSLLPVLGGVAAVLGHNFTCWLRFKGGKGVATSAGVLAGLMPLALVLVLSTFLLVLATFRIVSLGSLAAAGVLPFAAWFTRRDPLLLAVGVVLAAMVFWRHRANIERLRQGTEPRVGTSKSPPAA